MSNPEIGRKSQEVLEALSDKNIGEMTYRRKSEHNGRTGNTIDRVTIQLTSNEGGLLLEGIVSPLFKKEEVVYGKPIVKLTTFERIDAHFAEVVDVQVFPAVS